MVRATRTMAGGGLNKCPTNHRVALLINPNEHSLKGNLGYYYLETRNYDKAIEKFNECSRIDNNRVMVDAMLGLSIAYYSKKDNKNAKKYLQLAKKVKPVLKNNMKGLLELEREGYFYSPAVVRAPCHGSWDTNHRV